MMRFLRLNAGVTPIRGFSSCRCVLSGHNKWSTIKHDKAKNDAERNKLFNKFANQIALAVKMGGSPDPAINIRLATAIEMANKNNVTKKVVENAIKKGSGVSDKDGSRTESCVYEGMGPGGIAFVVEALTDNKNRTIGLVRAAFGKANGSMTPTLFFFDRKGYVVVQPPKELDNYEKVFEAVLELEGVDDLEQLPDEEGGKDETTPGCDPQVYELSTEPSQTNQIATGLKGQGFRIKEVGIGFVPKSEMEVEISDPETRAKLDKFIMQLDEIDDVTEIHCNVKQ